MEENLVFLRRFRGDGICCRIRKSLIGRNNGKEVFLVVYMFGRVYIWSNFSLLSWILWFMGLFSVLKIL